MARNSLYVLSRILHDDGLARAFLLSREVFYQNLDCPVCNSSMRRVDSQWCFKCTGLGCKKRISLSVHTFFSGVKLKTNEVLLLARLWLSKVSVESAMALTGHSSHTVGKFWADFRQLVGSSIEEEDVVIGGDGIIVEVDETKLGKRKYNRGHRVEGVWVVVGIERTPQRKCFAIPVETRDGATLRTIIENHVRPGTHVYTDLWRGYNWIGQESSFNHGVVNHSKHFKDPDTGVHTNTVEGTNSALKRVIPVRSRVSAGMMEHLEEFIWRRKHENDDLWECFIQAIRDIHYDIE